MILELSKHDRQKFSKMVISQSNKKFSKNNARKYILRERRAE